MARKGMEALNFVPETGSQPEAMQEIRAFIAEISEVADKLFRGTNFAKELEDNLRMKADLEFREGKIMKKEDYIKSILKYLGHYMMFEKDKSFNNEYKEEIVDFRRFLNTKT